MKLAAITNRGTKAEKDIMPKMYIPVDWTQVKQTVREAVIQFQKLK